MTPHAIRGRPRPLPLTSDAARLTRPPGG